MKGIAEGISTLNFECFTTSAAPTLTTSVLGFPSLFEWPLIL